MTYFFKVSKTLLINFIHLKLIFLRIILIKNLIKSIKTLMNRRKKLQNFANI